MLKKLDKFIQEAFNNPLPIRWVDKDDKLRGLFTVNNNIYQIVCTNRNNIWRYDFYYFKNKCEFTPELTELNSDKFRVLPTVEIGIKYLFENKNPDAIIFGASDKSKGRKKLYESFCQNFCEGNNLKFYTKIYTDFDKNIDRQIFIMYKENIDRNLLSDTVIKILEEEKI